MAESTFAALPFTIIIRFEVQVGFGNVAGGFWHCLPDRRESEADVVCGFDLRG
jgi:hypothetical protein